MLLVIVSAVVDPGFLRIRWYDGHLSGSLIDVLNRAAPLILVSLGMTLVIAVRGLDISVGAVVAIAGAVAALTIGAAAGLSAAPGDSAQPSEQPRFAACGTDCWS